MKREESRLCNTCEVYPRLTRGQCRRCIAAAHLARARTMILQSEAAFEQERYLRSVGLATEGQNELSSAIAQIMYLGD